jgi:hypothetical protein
VKYFASFLVFFPHPQNKNEKKMIIIIFLRMRGSRNRNYLCTNRTYQRQCQAQQVLNYNATRLCKASLPPDLGVKQAKGLSNQLR